MAHGQLFETPQIGADMKEQVAAAAYGKVGRNGDDYVDGGIFHTETWPLIAG